MEEPLESIERELEAMRPRDPSALLRSRLAAELDAPAAVAAATPPSSAGERVFWIGLAVAACAVVGVSAWLWWGPGRGPGAAGPGKGLPPPQVPHTAVELAEGCHLEPQGEAAYELIGPRRVQLIRGELLVRIDEAGASAAPLEIVTPAGEVRASATRFLVETWPAHSAATDSAEPSTIEENPTMKPARRFGPYLTRVLVVAGLVELVNPLGSVTGRPGELLCAETMTPPSKHVEDLAGKFGHLWKPVVASVKPSVPEYELPLKASGVANWEKVVEGLKLDAATDKLAQCGFVVVPLPQSLAGEGRDDIVKPYSALRRMEIPIFVTSDTLLHLYHVQFDESLKVIEQREFYPDMVALASMLVDRMEAEHRRLVSFAATADLTIEGRQRLDTQVAAAEKAWTFAGIGLKCLKPDWQPPKPIAGAVDQVIAKIEEHEGFWPPPSAAYQQWPLFRYSEDFSQYVPRGHYTRSEELKRYFKAMMWFGRMTFLLKGEEPYGPADQPALVAPEEAVAQTLAAAEIVKAVAEGKLGDGRDARHVWERIYTVTAFYVGAADDLGLSEYDAALRKVLGPKMDLAGLTEPDRFRALQVELARFGAPAIYGGSGNLITFRIDDPDALVAALGKTTGFRLMGQRFIPDSYVMGRLVFPTVGAPRAGTDMFTCVPSAAGPIRGFPRGLDVAAWLGSHRARHWLSALRDDAYGTGTDLEQGKNLRYDVVLDGLVAEFAGLSPSDWNRNAYWSWLYSLKALLKDYGQGYPTFMTTDAWQDKSMNTVLASWAQLRHDTILYAKQSYTMRAGSAFMPKPVEGYVEPVPELYARLLATTRMTLAGLQEMDALQPQAAERLEKLAEIIEKLLAISRKELAHQELTREEYDFIRYFARSLERIRVDDPELRKAAEAAAKAGDRRRAQELWQELSGERPMKTTLVADVHTDSNTEQVLEEATGQVDLVVVCYLQPDGRLVLGAGPVLSYYELKHPMADRLTDESWRAMLESGQATRQPEWTEGYRAE